MPQQPPSAAGWRSALRGPGSKQAEEEHRVERIALAREAACVGLLDREARRSTGATPRFLEMPRDGVEPMDESAKARFEIRKSRRGMAFVRAAREIETVDIFPRRPSDVASGMGDWPLLQSYAYHWGIEVQFQPALDEVFGITNDKQTVRPIEDFWRLLATEGIDALLHREQNVRVPGTLRFAGVGGSRAGGGARGSGG